jgi:electron transport complex protein RnfB
MTEEVYKKLAKHLARLPAGYPSTESGVELRILQQLFTPTDAGLAIHLTLIPEEPRVISYRAGIPLEEAISQLHEMDQKGLIFGTPHKGGSMQYRIQQFIIGFWEGQVNKLSPELVLDFEEYFDSFIDLDLWQKIPQLRTIPVGESIRVKTDVMPYERAEELVKAQTILAVNNCICRQEQRIIGKGCNKPEESCLSFGQAAERGLRQNRGRAITQKEAMEILHRAEKAGLILQTGNARKALFLCTCCGCCCGALRCIKHDPKPASRVSSPFVMSLNINTCIGCGNCIDRCQMDAILLDEGKAILDLNRCIGCGLCVSTCPTNSYSLQRKPKAKQPYVPGTLLETYVRLGHVSGRMRLSSLIRMKIKSATDRLKIPNNA